MHKSSHNLDIYVGERLLTFVPFLSRRVFTCNMRKQKSQKIIAEKRGIEFYFKSPECVYAERDFIGLFASNWGIQPVQYGIYRLRIKIATQKNPALWHYGSPSRVQTLKDSTAHKQQ